MAMEGILRYGGAASGSPQHADEESAARSGDERVPEA